MDPVPSEGHSPRRPEHSGAQTTFAVAGWNVSVWALVPSAAAPVLLVAGIFVAGSLQPHGFNPARDTISALAALNAAHRGVMTAALALLGLAYVGTAITLVAAGVVSRVLLGLGGLCTVLVTLFPLGPGPSAGHAVFASLSFFGLTMWPLGLVWRGTGAGWSSAHPFPAPERVALAVTLVLGVLVGWFAIEVVTHGPRIGLSERVVAVTESFWPLVVVLIARHSRLPADRQFDQAQGAKGRLPP